MFSQNPFKHNLARDLFHCRVTKDTRKFPQQLQAITQRKLIMLGYAPNLEALRSPPGNRLEQLKGDRLGQWSVRINDQWRICFIWDGQTFSDIEVVDYH